MTDLPPGRELDALIAEKVMGWVKQENSPEIDDWRTPENDKRYKELVDKGIFLPYRRSYFYGQNARVCFSPSTDISAALEVITKLQSLGKSFEMTWDAHEINKKFTVSNFNCEGLPYRGWSFEDKDICESSESAPHAICLASLKAVS